MNKDEYPYWKIVFQNVYNIRVYCTMYNDQPLGSGSVPGEKNPMKNIFTLQSSLGLSFIETKFSTNMHLIQKVYF